MMKRCWILVLTAVSLALASCGGSCDHYVNYLYKTLELPDRVAMSRDYWEANVRKTLEVRERMDWGIPEREFRHFVLPLRVSSEPLDDFRTLYADTLCARVAGLSMTAAALEINHWCLSQATFSLAEGGMASPLQTLCRGVGRCNEESVLVVAAMRAAGIPARLTYSPRWSHTDGGHSWVEVWTGDGWHFLGACEPDPRLDMSWFDCVVARSHAIFTYVSGAYHGNGHAVARTSGITKLNVMERYAPIRRSVVRVVGTDGRPVRGARGECRVYNYGAYRSLYDKKSNARGRMSFDTGYGDLVAWASQGPRFGLAPITGTETTVTLDHVVGDRFGLDFDLIPPPNHPLPRVEDPAEMAANERRNAQDDAVRGSRPRGNEAVLSAFLATHDDAPARALLASLSDRDQDFVTREVLEDAYAHIAGSFRPLRDCPRIEEEPLKSFFAELGAGLNLESREAVADWVEQNIRLVSWYNPMGVRMAPVDVWRSRQADRRSRDIFQVALCRAMGIEADYIAPDAADSSLPKGRLEVVPAGPLSPEYEHHFTLSRIENGTTHVLPLGTPAEHKDWSDIFPLALAEGYYMLTTGLRMVDFSVLTHVEFFQVAADSTTVVPLVMRDPGDRLYVWGTADMGRFVDLTGREFFLIAVLGDRDETTRQYLQAFAELEPQLKAWGRPLLATGPAAAELPQWTSFDDADGTMTDLLISGSKRPSHALPLVAVCDGWNRIVYVSQGSNPRLGEEIDHVIAQLME